MTYYAHSGQQADRSDWQTLAEHLTSVASLAEQRAAAFNSSEIGHLVGLLHDLGKFTPEFQRRLDGDSTRTDHATAGAKVLLTHLVDQLGAQWRPLANLLAFSIAGHHAGLANGLDDGDGRSTLKQRLALAFGQDIPELNPVWRDEIQLPAKLNFPNLKQHNPPDKHRGFGLAFFARMVFSCLIDADRMDTENYVRRVEGRKPLWLEQPDIDTLRNQLSDHLGRLSATTKNTPLNEVRNEILKSAIASAANSPGIFSLTVPTGGGKTLTSLAFGLHHAAKHKLRRVIYVIPFTSIIEQTAAVFRQALGNYSHSVLEHHSAFDRERLPIEVAIAGKLRKTDYRDKLRLTMDTWDSPVIVTTAVQFFESLFSDRPSQCRKLHNIAGSVIVLDEAQTLPLKLLRPIMASIDELALNYGCSIVLCTATQPALLESDSFHHGFKNVREIAPNPQGLFQQLKRTRVRAIGSLDDQSLVGHLNAHDQILMIVNNRRHARSLYDRINTANGAYHLTTAMCAEHRSRVLSEVRSRLKQGKSCKLIATALIEAGVDVDFPIVFRAEAGLDSIAQAAGRCNREGLRPVDSSEVLVFQSLEWKAPPDVEQLAAPMRSILRNASGDVLAPDTLRAYFRQVYSDKGSDLDQKKILTSIRSTQDCMFPFQNIARDFKMIDSHMLTVIIPFDEIAKETLHQLRTLSDEFSVIPLSRKLQRYTVQVPEKVFIRLIELGAIEPIKPERYGTQFYELIAVSIYDRVAGLSLSDPVALSAETTVF